MEELIPKFGRSGGKSSLSEVHVCVCVCVCKQYVLTDGGVETYFVNLLSEEI